MWQRRPAELLATEIDELLSPLSDTVELFSLVQKSLTEVIQRLTDEKWHHHPWPLLPLIVCEAISGRYERVIPAATALQLFMVAGDIFDDIEDADSSDSLPARYGSAIATNIATTILFLAEKAITRLKERDVDDNLIVRVMDVINLSFITTCTGQHLDLSLILETNLSEDTYLKIADMKTASTTRCACHIGALLATEHQDLVDTFVKFGHNLGIASQIANDIQGIIHGSDILNRKVTLPVIYALSHADKETQNQLKSIFGEKSEAVPNSAQIKDLLFNSGAIHYATIQMELYKQQSLDILSVIEAEGISIERLRLFLE
jgi:competence protein ComQ